jgi:hypothetical protein
MNPPHTVTGHNVQRLVNVGVIHGDIHQVINEHSLVNEEEVRYTECLGG